MTEKEIIENNKLIAEFMGFEKTFVRNCDGIPYDYNLPDMFELIKEVEIYIESERGWGLEYQDNCQIVDLKFHSSWDWLMPCIGKISNVCEEPEELDGLKYALLTNNIEEAWKFVVNYLIIS